MSVLIKQTLVSVRYLQAWYHCDMWISISPPHPLGLCQLNGMTDKILIGECTYHGHAIGFLTRFHEDTPMNNFSRGERTITIIANHIISCWSLFMRQMRSWAVGRSLRRPLIIVFLIGPPKSRRNTWKKVSPIKTKHLEKSESHQGETWRNTRREKKLMQMRSKSDL